MRVACNAVRRVGGGGGGGGTSRARCRAPRRTAERLPGSLPATQGCLALGLSIYIFLEFPQTSPDAKLIFVSLLPSIPDDLTLISLSKTISALRTPPRTNAYLKDQTKLPHFFLAKHGTNLNFSSCDLKPCLNVLHQSFPNLSTMQVE